ncbi:MAG: phosphatidate cytidylyltransferase [Clostridia bacterium]|nr:phosphatidate cytidylyltransferase [Clostridia bacterium]
MIAVLQRILTSAVGLVVFFAVLFSSKTVFGIGICVLIFGMLYEFYRTTSAKSAVAALGVVSAALLVAGSFFSAVREAIVLSVLLYMSFSVFLYKKVDFKEIYSSAFITWYIVLFMLTIVEVRYSYGVYETLLIFICAWITDTSAYFTGVFLGKNKLAPAISPKKTIEGSIGGVVGTMFFCGLYMLILNSFFHYGGDYFKIVVLGFIASILSQVGDLVASAIKRECGVKDFGTIFPGHGGILDRFDSVIFVAPVVFYFISYIGLR